MASNITAPGSKPVRVHSTQGRILQAGIYQEVLSEIAGTTPPAPPYSRACRPDRRLRRESARSAHRRAPRLRTGVAHRRADGDDGAFAKPGVVAPTWRARVRRPAEAKVSSRHESRWTSLPEREFLGRRREDSARWHGDQRPRAAFSLARQIADFRAHISDTVIQQQRVDLRRSVGLFREVAARSTLNRPAVHEVPMLISLLITRDLPDLLALGVLVAIVAWLLIRRRPAAY
jgi:hypothetical protein